jgi:hypothetical protein
VAQLLALLLDLLLVRCRTVRARDLEIAWLRQQRCLLRCQHTQGTRWHRVVLAVLAHKVHTLARQCQLKSS